MKTNFHNLLHKKDELLKEKQNNRIKCEEMTKQIDAITLKIKQLKQKRVLLKNQKMKLENRQLGIKQERKNLKNMIITHCSNKSL